LYDQTGGSFEFVVVHEAAHQWWYGLVGNDQVDEPWLDEALAQYSTLLYFEEVHGTRAASEVRRRVFEDPHEELIEEGRDLPVGQPVRAFSREEYGAVVYGKGPLLFQDLRDEVGEDVFRSILRTYLRAHLYGVATTDTLLAVAEEVSGRDLDSLFAEWIGPPAEPQ
jgi:aminopeptidase N